MKSWLRRHLVLSILTTIFVAYCIIRYLGDYADPHYVEQSKLNFKKLLKENPQLVPPDMQNEQK